MYDNESKGQVDFGIIEKDEANDEAHVNEIDSAISSFIKKLTLNTDLFSNYLQNELESLKDVYTRDSNKTLRHSYANIFNCLIREITEDGKISIDENGKLSNISLNLENAYNVVKKSKNEIFKQKFFKFYDHTKLEYARITFWASRDDKIKSDIETLQNILNNSEQNANNIKNIVNQAQREADSLKSSQVAVLGIFIAILLTVVTQINYTGNIINIANNIEMGKIILLISFCAFFTINIIFLLLYIVSRLIDKNILIDCVQENYPTTCNQCKKCCFLFKFMRRLPYLFWPNILIVSVIVLTYYIFFR